MTRLTRDPIDPAAVAEAVRDPHCGAVVLFLGTVRDLTGEQVTVALDYEAYGPMAEKKLADVEAEVRRRWPVGGVAIVHRLGRLGVGDVSVAVAVSAPHRGQAFDAGQFAIDAVKELVPIWKKENAPDGSGGWVHPGRNVMADLPRVYLVRHGETEWSRSGRHTGRTDLPLTARGERLAGPLGTRLAGVPFALVLSSPLARARRTAERAGFTPDVDPDLAEWDYGDYEGMTGAEVRAVRPGWRLFRDGAAGGEGVDQIAARADRVAARLRAAAGNVLVFSHGHFLRVLAARWVGEPVAFAGKLLLDTGAVSVLGFDHNSPDEPAIAVWNSPAAE